jgi:intracellular sulfur oxidation DsrE/DsrF family protein
MPLTAPRRALLAGLPLALLASRPVLAQPSRNRLVVHVDSADPAVMRLAVYNATNVIDAVRKQGGEADIELIANGPGIAMLIADRSPVRDLLREVHTAYPGMVFSACAVSLAAVEAKTGHPLPIVPEARVVPSGALRIMELQEQHWAYMKP